MIGDGAPGHDGGAGGASGGDQARARRPRAGAEHQRAHLSQTVAAALQAQLRRGLADPRVEGSLITITGVTLQMDPPAAIAMVSVLPETHEARVLGALRHAAGHLRHAIGATPALRAVRLPTLIFELDRSLKRQAGVIEALARARAEREQSGAEGGGRAEAGEAPGEPDDRAANQA